MSATRRIALVDDHRMFSDGFSALLMQLRDGHIVDVFDDPVDFLKSFQSDSSYDLIILDLVMRTMNGLALLAAIRERKSRCPVLMLSGIGADPPLAEMKKLGARGFVHKSADTETLLAAVDGILAGQTRFFGAPDPDADGDEDDDWPPRGDRPLPRLGQRQLEIVHLMAGGATNKEVAATLNISENTVKSHMRAIFEALDVHTRTACVRKAQALGMI
ncbi:MAG: DNA-binding NarL/FixJ family response regulator [Maricaulis maris]|jgi:DNA-binding NarL/FixJ family response regulator|uniref:Two component transcriptional regulator, LuxR family n=1 Tax=Maricaulis maris (strain MCS10) TaxID=394221 RepID=Q0AL58_MARMM|nr:response regulator transcription factor [Maricaulis maris]ABI66985.1 two component transcriptional regulator, LuxR family [Maricaulis maris MCS10]